MKKHKKYFFMYIMVVVVFCISVGYAAINRTLNITGSSEVKQNTWDVYFENIQITSGSVEAISEPEIDENSKLAVNFNFMLNLPGDFYEFIVDVRNSGSIDAMIESIVKTPELTSEQVKYMNYIIEYLNGEQLQTKQLVNAGEFVRLKVRVEYKDDLLENDLPTSDEILNLGFIVNYVQSDSTAVLVKNSGIIGANGDINEIGTVVTIGTEKFYTIGTDDENVKLFSMHNLYIGGIGEASTYYWNAYGEEATGMQNKNMIGWNDVSTIGEGVTQFSSNEQMGINSNDYEGSIVEEYVNAYKVKLEEKFNVQIKDARLITYDELVDDNLGCTPERYSCADSKFEWVYSSSYWTQTSYNVGIYIWGVNSMKNFTYVPYLINTYYGVRPVIVISKDYFN